MSGLPASLQAAVQGANLDTLSPEEFVEVLADTLPSLAAEFTHVHLEIPRRCLPQLCADLRLGMTERLVADCVEQGIPADEARREIDPGDFTFPRRLETYGAISPAVAMDLESDVARLLALDLSCGILYRPDPKCGPS